MTKITWGIIGCGDVTEIKSGPAFNKVKNSSLVAVMRRDGARAMDYARRHGVAKWYDDADKLINDPDVNAIYVATPPSSHEQYVLAGLEAGKPVYVEKPMTIDHASALRMQAAVHHHNGKLVVAHYRRAQPLFQKVKELLERGVIGDIRLINLAFRKIAFTEEELRIPKYAWRVDEAVAGGGLFHDLAPHQLDILYYFFGEASKINGIASNQAGKYDAADIVAGSILFESGIVFQGTWCFNVSEADQKDSCEIVGSKGSIRFAFFDMHPVELMVNGEVSVFPFEALAHVQQPMIEKVVEYFLGTAENPCSVEEGVKVMGWIDVISRR